MRYLLLSLMVGVTVVGAGWVALDAPVGDEWRQDLLDLEPFGELGDPGAADNGVEHVKKKRRKRRKTPRHSVSAVKAPAPAPTKAAPSSSPADAHYQKGLAYLQQKRIPPAITELKKCIALDPQHALAYRALGMANSVLGKQSSAVEAFRKFVKLAPGHKDTPKVRAIIEAHDAGK